MQSIFRPAARRKSLGEQSEGGRRDGGLKMLCIMFYTLRQKKGQFVVTLEIILRDSLSDNLGAVTYPLTENTCEKLRHCNRSFKSTIHTGVVFLYVARRLLQFRVRRVRPRSAPGNYPAN